MCIAVIAVSQRMLRHSEDGGDDAHGHGADDDCERGDADDDDDDIDAY